MPHQAGGFLHDSDAQLLWWRWFTEREDVGISLDNFTFLFDGDSPHIQYALGMEFRDDVLLIQGLVFLFGFPP